ncbi:ABC transporter permease [Paenalcaligenes hermetiae]|uniref:ABC transporter permease n=1 Tax=Paenalcaligenes hermetiae TaxID=1157987 RepID=A0ABP9M9S6_9BURK
MVNFLFGLLRKIGFILLTSFLLSFIVFFILRAIPADPLGMMLPPSATQADADLLRAELGLDGSLFYQYWIWLKSVAQGDLGNSIFFKQSVNKLLWTALPATIELSLVSLMIALIISIPGGVVFYLIDKKKVDFFADFLLVFIISIPSFLWGIILIIVFGVFFPVLPFMGRIEGSLGIEGGTGFLLFDFLVRGRWVQFWDALKHLLLPALALALAFSPIIIRVLKASLLEVENEQYVAVARLRGVSETRVLLVHMLKNAALPTITLIGVQFGFLFGGTLLIEVIFSFPGIGNLMVQAIKNHDLPLIQGVALIFCLMILVINFSVDALYSILNPRLR